MTIRDRAFWLYLLCIIVVGMAIWLTIFTTLYHPGLELRESFVVLDTDDWSISLQWPRGEISAWFNTARAEWRIWPP